MNKKLNLVIWLGIASTALLLVVLLFLDNDNDVYEKPLSSNQVGWYQEISNKSDSQLFTHYELMTPRGLEEVVGYKNLSNSLTVYINNDVYGAVVEEN